MVFSDLNTSDLRSRVFKGFVQFEDGSDTFRLKERQTLNITYNFVRETHYNDQGIKSIDPAGHNHRFNLVIKVTPDLFDNVDPPTDTKTISYWIHQNMPPQNAPVEIVFVATAEGLKGPSSDTAEKFIAQRFTLNPDTFGPVTWNPRGGTNEITIGGEVISIDKIVRTSSDPASSTP